ncbi:uncharacterized protein LOC110762133 [Prunus avium]|uniref:Uncharacterized protein LOC110762133 n=1 Tax=Prunus avium TaxID=42229 RepID=A0A6P5SUA4_PRUAV|nr:uncharacterized protein LOC110762133 [Prunus avium]
MWSIWKARCKAVFEQVRPNPLEVLIGAREAWSEFLQKEVCPGSINRVGGEDSMVNPGLSWCAPPNPFLKLNVDASWQKDSGLAGLGIIIRNHMGDFKYGKVLKTTTGSVEIAEAQAIIEVLSFALENGITHVYVESDSKKVMDNCAGNIAKGDWGIYPSLCRIQDLKSKFSAVRWAWIPREANAVADAAAAIAFGGMGTEVWVDRPPSSLVHVLSRDGLPCPP